MSSRIGVILGSILSKSKAVPKRPNIFKRDYHLPQPHAKDKFEISHNPAFLHGNQLEASKKQVDSMVKQGYKPEHILVTPKGHVVYDLEAVEHDAFQKALKESRKAPKTSTDKPNK